MDIGNTQNHNSCNNQNQSNQSNKRDSHHHQRTIIHFDMDCYYAQVEEIRDPALRNQPLGIQQKNIVVTCNYNARCYGITKLMLVDQAKRLCPNLVLVNGEDLTPYRQMSQKIFDRLLKYTKLVEKLGLDEHFLDVSALVEQRRRQLTPNDAKNIKVQGNIYPAHITVDTFQTSCNFNCDCPLHLAIASCIAQEIRQDLFHNLEITCCAGISFNKLLAKLVGSQNKPNKQTILVSSYSEQFMRELFDLHRITGIGHKTTTLLLENGITNIDELQKCDTDILRKTFGYETALKLKDLAFGRDNGTVRNTGKPKTISLEDSCKPISVRNDVEERFRLLLMRLMEQVAEDGRIPVSIKVILRKFDTQKNSSHRETKQANILPSLFKVTPCTDTGGAKVILADDAQEKLLRVIMRLFERVIDLSKPFNITLIGLAFSKFQQRKMGSSSIANYLIKKTDLEVQSITLLTNTDISKDGSNTSGIDNCSDNSNKKDKILPTASNKILDNDSFLSSPTTFQPSDQFYRRRNATLSPIPMLTDNGSESGATNSDFSDISENEVEPSPKKSRIGSLLFNKRRCLRSVALSVPLDITSDIASPSKLRVYDLRLNSHESDRDVPMSPNITTKVSSSNVTATTLSVSDGSKMAEQFNIEATQSVMENSTNCTSTPTLPSSITSANNIPFNKNDCLENFRKNSLIFSKRRHSYGSSISTLPSPMDDSNSSDSTSIIQLPCSSIATISSNVITKQTHCDETFAQSEQCTSARSKSMETEHVHSSIIKTCPAGVDPQVFKELPLDVQNELIASWRTSLALAISNGTITQNANNNDSTSSDSNLLLSQQKSRSITRSGRNVSAITENTSNTIGREMKTNSETNGANGANGAQKNTLYRYFMRDK